MNTLDHVMHITKLAGKFLKEKFYDEFVVEGKGPYDIVSEVDIASEKMIIEYLSGYFPEYSIVAEESGTHDKNSEYVWYIDPLDGTSNFVTGNPYFSVSIALAHRGEVILGVVYNPISDELFTAEVGKGAFCNGKRISVSSPSDLSKGLIAGVYAANKINKSLSTVENLVVNSRKVVINFSPALDLCNIARGKVHALVDMGTTPEDHAAGSLILTEAGGVLTNYDYANWDIDVEGVIGCCSKGMLKKVQKTM